MTVYERALASRTVRRYSQNKIPTHSELVSFIECARVSPSAANRQRVRFALIEGERADAAYAGISLGGYLPEDKRPSYENRPTAYIVLMSECDEDTNLAIDIGIYAQTIALAASEAGYGTCMIRSFRREHIIPLTEAEGLKAHHDYDNKYNCHNLLVFSFSEILLNSSCTLSAITFAYRCVCRMLVWPSIRETFSILAPLRSIQVAKV